MYSLVTDEAKNDLDLNAAYPTFQQAFNWINEEKIKLTKKDLRYKKRKVKKTSMMNHTRWDSNNKTVLPISLGAAVIVNTTVVAREAKAARAVLLVMEVSLAIMKLINSIWNLMR